MNEKFIWCNNLLPLCYAVYYNDNSASARNQVTLEIVKIMISYFTGR